MAQSNSKKTGDVLASLRRIVAEEFDDAPLQGKPKTTTLEKLVLTPSLRVSGTDQNASNTPPLVLSNSLEAKVSLLEQIISNKSEIWEPDGAETDNDLAGQVTSVLPRDRVADAPRDEFDAPIASAAKTPAKNDIIDLSEEEMDAFRDMVAEIIRQELKGVLGEKITQNIRKMVRTEIVRALQIKNP